MKDTRSQYEKDQQELLFATNIGLEAELLPIADTPEDAVDTFKEQRCQYQINKLKQIEEDILKLQHMLLGDDASFGSVLSNQIAIEKMESILEQVSSSIAYLNDMLINGLKRQDMETNLGLEKVNLKIDKIEENISVKCAVIEKRLDILDQRIEAIVEIPLVQKRINKR